DAPVPDARGRAPSRTKHGPPNPAQSTTQIRTEKTGERSVVPSFSHRIFMRADTTVRIRRPQRPGCLLASAGSLFRSRVEEKLAHLAGHTAGDGSLLRPCECLIHIGGFQYPESAHVLLGLGVRPVG